MFIYYNDHSSSSLGYSSSYLSSCSGGHNGSTSRFYRNLACFKIVVLLLRVFLFTVTLNPWIQTFEGNAELLSRTFTTRSRWRSALNGLSLSFRFRPSNSTGPKINGLIIFFWRICSKPLFVFMSNVSWDAYSKSPFVAGNTSSSSSAYPFLAVLTFFGLFFLASSKAFCFFSSKLRFKAFEASKIAFYWFSKSSIDFL